MNRDVDSGLKQRNRRTMGVIVGVVGGMIVLALSSPPLYDWFRGYSGYSGTSRSIAVESQGAIDRKVTVRFDANISPELPWKFYPVERSVVLNVGQNAIAWYTAESTGAEASAGMATFNVTPVKAGEYFVKLDCFCFIEQRIEAGQSATMPIAFYVDPAIDDDPGLVDVDTITLSFFFFPSWMEKNRKDEELALARP